MTEVAKKIRAAIAEQGAIPFSDFMEMALYCPEYGYYERQKDRIGRGGDFYTSVSVGPVFGQLLACQFAQWLVEADGSAAGARLCLVEAGSHGGQLAGDVLSWLRDHRTSIFENLDYVILEPSERRRGWQRETLQAFAPTVAWAADFSELPKTNRRTIIFSNELLDAFPVRRFRWNMAAQQWRELGVTLSRDSFSWTELPQAQGQFRKGRGRPRPRIPSALSGRNSGDEAVPAPLPASHELALPGAELELTAPQLPAELKSVLPEGYLVDVSPAANNWWQSAAEWLQNGRLLTIDYGLNSEELFLPERANGTLRGFYKHGFVTDLLANPGEQDLTAHVNFSDLQKIGEAAGLTTAFLGTQTRFLTRIVAGSSEELSWGQKEKRQFQTLTHLEHLGRAFRVLVQTRRS